MQNISNHLDMKSLVLLFITLVIVAFGKSGEYVGACERERERERPLAAV
jgi:hypothetical protein